MNSILLRIFFTASIYVVVVKTQQLISPCPEVLKYESITTDTDRWYGTIHLRSEATLNGVFVDIILDRPSHLLGNWFGSVSSSDNIQYTITNRTHRIQSHRDTILRFFVKYSETEQVPSVREIRLNGRQICPSESVIVTERTRPTTRLTTLYTRPTTQRTPAPNPNGFGDLNGNGDNFRPTNPPIYTSRRTTAQSWATQRPTASSTEDEGWGGDFKPGALPGLDTIRPKPPITLDVPCGVVAARPKPLITHGQPTQEGQWPWHAAIYRSKSLDLAYICGATLVSRGHTVTAAHCVTRAQSNLPINHEHLLVYLGKYKLKNWSNVGIQNIPISSITIHPEFNSTNFNNDVAILHLAKDAEFTDYVRPICLWQESPDISTVIGRDGTVIGWGFDESGYITDDLMMARMPVVSREVCVESYREFFWRFTSSTTYCAGYKNGTSVCNGDSGGGMVFRKPNTNPPVWQLRGVVSISVALQNDNVCDSNHYVVFADLAKHQAWIVDNIAVNNNNNNNRG